MENYLGVLQNAVLIADGEYRVTFRAYRESDVERHRWKDEEAPFEIYSMVARLVEGEYMFIGEGELGECIKVYRDSTGLKSLAGADRRKYKIGVLANDIMVSLADRGFMTPWSVEED